MTDKTPDNETEHADNKYSGSQPSNFDFKNGLDFWKDFYRSDAKHDAEINSINRQLTEIKTDIKSLETKMGDLEKSLNNKIDKVLLGFDINVNLMKNERSWNKSISIATLFVFFVVLIVTIFLTYFSK
jgi:hypothetical protein